MIGSGSMPASHGEGDVVIFAGSNNFLDLDISRLHERAAEIREQGFTPVQLGDLYTRFSKGNGLFSQFLETTEYQVERRHGNEAWRSFLRGVVLCHTLLDHSLPTGVPAMHLGDIKVAGEYRNHPDTLDELALACDGLLASQTELQTAFMTGFEGLPTDTQLDKARFGGGVFTLGVMATLHVASPALQAWSIDADL